MDIKLRWVRLQVEGHVYPHATADEVESAIRGLDGVGRTLVTIELESGTRLTVAGGPERFVAEVAEDDVRRWAVINPLAGDDLVDLVVGGQTVDYPARLCLDKESVLKAARAFVLGGGAKSDHLTWSVET